MGKRGGCVWAEFGERVNMIKNTLYEILNELIKLIKFKRSSQSIVELRKHAKGAIEKKSIWYHLFMEPKIYK